MSKVVQSPFTYISRIKRDSTLDERISESEMMRTLAPWEKYDSIDEVRYDDIIYPFFSQVNVRYELSGQKWKYYFAEVFMPLRGEGETFEEAKQEWERLFHVRFQELYVKCWWERTDEEQRDWEIFETIVDIPSFRIVSPIEFTETGKVLSVSWTNENLINLEIEWLDGQYERLECPVVSNDAISLVPGNYYAMKLLRNYQTNIVIKILSVDSSDYRPLTSEEIFLWSQPLSIEGLPDTVWVTASSEE